jgi:hypothetical protein
MIKKIPFVIAAIALGCQVAYAQTRPQGAAVVASEPGKAAIAETIKASVVVTKIDKASRTVTMKSASGEIFDVVAGDEVRNFDQVKVGDQVVVQYARALPELKRPAPVSGPTVATGSGGGRAAKARRCGRLAGDGHDHDDVDPKNKTIFAEGARKATYCAECAEPDWEGGEGGDKVEAVYTEAVVISVEPAAKK